MTTIAYDRVKRTIAADTQNTDSSGALFRVSKVDSLTDGRYFLGSGHLRTINMAKAWAEKDFSPKHEPDWSYFLADTEDRGFSCLIVSKDGYRVWFIDDELTPTEILDEYTAIGAGSAYALGAMDAGASAEQAVKIACLRDSNSSEPVEVVVIT